MSEFLQFLIPDRDYGYLFPHSRAVAAFGCMNEYHITKHRPHLTEGVHFIKSAGNGADRVTRVFYTFNGLLLLSDLVGTAQAVQLKQALLDHAQRQAQASGALVPAHGSGMSYTQPQVAPQRHYDSLPSAQPQQWGQPAIHQPGHNQPGQLAPKAHGYLPVQQSYGQSYGQSGQADPAQQVAAALAPYVDRSVSRHLGTAQSQQEQALQLVDGVANTMLRVQEQTATHISRAYEQAAGNPNAQQQQRSTPEVLLLAPQQPSYSSSWFRANDGWFTLLLGVSLVALVGVGSWLIASVVMNGLRPNSPPSSQPVRLAPAYPSSATPLNEVSFANQSTN